MNIPLTQGKVAIVDDEDYETLIQFTWSAHRSRNCWYARTRIQGMQFGMHELVLGEKYVDHINRNGLDNRRENLRFCTNSQNQMNKGKQSGSYYSRYKGVTRHRSGWMVRIQVNGKRIQVGYFKVEEDAAVAYNMAALKYHGEFARLNAI